ncbi:MAG: metal-sulfur cluster assembly factor [Ktedonobacterales bacterium]
MTGQSQRNVEPTEESLPLRERVIEVLHAVYDPELGINIVDLGLVYDVEVTDERRVTITMTLTTPGCQMHDSIGEGIGAALQSVEGVTGGEVNVVWEPRWEPSMMSEAGRAALGCW